jgi:hypothetical protein
MHERSFWEDVETAKAAAGLPHCLSNAYATFEGV